jgi:hypothetical protein
MAGNGKAGAHGPGGKLHDVLIRIMFALALRLFLAWRIGGCWYCAGIRAGLAMGMVVGRKRKATSAINDGPKIITEVEIEGVW